MCVGYYERAEEPAGGDWPTFSKKNEREDEEEESFPGDVQGVGVEQWSVVEDFATHT